MQCFWTHGYRATSLQRLLQATGLSKSSLYGALGDKDGVFSRCLARYRRDLLSAMEDRLAEAESARDFVAAVLDGLVREAGESEPRGCLVMNSASELGRELPSLAREVNHCIDRVVQLFHRAMLLGQADGSIDSTRNAEDLARYLMAHIGGVRNMIQGSAVDPEQVRRLNSIVLDCLT